MKRNGPPPSAPEPSLPMGRGLVWLLGGAAGLLAAVLLVSALVHGWAYKKSLTGDYVLLAVDVREQMNVSKMLSGGDAVGVVPATVFAVGWNADFIIAQQHPLSADTSKGARVTHFYLLRTADGASWGPLTAEQFQEERANQGVPSNLSFTLVFQDLE